MYHASDRLNHGHRIFRLKHVASHIHTGRTALNGSVAQLQCFKSRQLFSAGNHDRSRAPGDNLFEAIAVVRLDDLGS